jgi:hypothetical protein
MAFVHFNSRYLLQISGVLAPPDNGINVAITRDSLIRHGRRFRQTYALPDHALGSYIGNSAGALAVFRAKSPEAQISLQRPEDVRQTGFHICEGEACCFRRWGFLARQDVDRVARGTRDKRRVLDFEI